MRENYRNYSGTRRSVKSKNKDSVPARIKTQCENILQKFAKRVQRFAKICKDLQRGCKEGAKICKEGAKICALRCKEGAKICKDMCKRNGPWTNLTLRK